MQARRALILGIEDVDAAGAKAGHDQEAPCLVLIAVTRAARIPAEVVKFVAQVGHHRAVDDL